MDALLQILLKLAQWFWRKGFLNVVNIFFAIIHLPLEKCVAFKEKLNVRHRRMLYVKVV